MALSATSGPRESVKVCFQVRPPSTERKIIGDEVRARSGDLTTAATSWRLEFAGSTAARNSKAGRFGYSPLICAFGPTVTRPGSERALLGAGALQAAARRNSETSADVETGLMKS